MTDETNFLKIWKYELELSDYVTLTMPIDSKILSVQINEKTGKCNLWVVVNSNSEDPTKSEERKFRIIGTGHRIGETEYKKLKYIDTIQYKDGELIFHIFEILLKRTWMEWNKILKDGTVNHKIFENESISKLYTENEFLEKINDYILQKNKPKFFIPDFAINNK